MVKAAGLLPRGKLRERREELPYYRLDWHSEKRPFIPPTVVAEADVATLERIDLQIEEDRRAQRRERLAPDVDPGRALDGKMDLDPLVTERQQVAVVAEVEEFLAGRGALAGEHCGLVIAVHMHFVRGLADLVAFKQLLFHVGRARRGQQGRQPVFAGKHAGNRRTGFDDAWPADKARHAKRALESGVFLAAERRHARIRPQADHRAVVGRVDHDRVIGQPQRIDFIEQLADERVVLDHRIGVKSQPRLAQILLLDVGEVVHARRVEPDEERLVILLGALQIIAACRENLFVDRLHALLGQRAGVLDCLSALAVGFAFQYSARTELLLELRVLGIVRILGLLFGVEMIEVAEELIESMQRRQELVAITKMVLAELRRLIAQRLEQLGYGRVFLAQVPDWRLGVRLLSGRCDRAIAR